ncbi:MAG: hypothetical protein WD826_02620, partial [Actinomycetota bacterium]
FPQFAAPAPVAERPTGEGAMDLLPEWAGPFNHATTSDPTYVTRHAVVLTGWARSVQRWTAGMERADAAAW